MQWLQRALLLSAAAAGALALRRLWYGASSGGTLPLDTASLMLLAGACLVAGLSPLGSRSARRWRLFAARVLLVSASVGFALFAAEIGLRGYFERRLRDNSIERLREYESGKEVPIVSSHPLAAIVRLSPDPGLVYELRANLDMEFGQKRLRTNRAGMRQNTDPPLDRAPGTVRILGLGDSGMFGWGVEQGGDYLSLLEATLGRRGDGVRYEVLNLAVPGYNTQLEVEAFRRRGARYRPDIVILGWSENDFGLPYFVTEKPNFWRTDVSYLEALVFRRDDFESLIGEYVRDQRSWTPHRVADSLKAGSGEAGVREALRSLQDMARDQGFHLLVFGPLKEKILGIVTDLGIDFYDTIAEIPRGEVPKEFAVHFMHPRPAGHRLLAERLEQTLRRRGWLAPRDHR
ncbi:MAG: SGNH/GDSL hydrolase family protein [Candidatus Binatia bacterium]